METVDIANVSRSTCGTCAYHEDFTGACFNGLSEHCADFTSNDDSCKEYERKILDD